MFDKFTALEKLSEKLFGDKNNDLYEFVEEPIDGLKKLPFFASTGVNINNGNLYLIGLSHMASNPEVTGISYTKIGSKRTLTIPKGNVMMVRINKVNYQQNHDAFNVIQGAMWQEAMKSNKTGRFLIMSNGNKDLIFVYML